MSFKFELRLTALRSVMGISRDHMFRIGGTSYRKMRYDQFLKLVEFLEDRADRIPELDEIPGMGQIKKLIEQQIGLLIKDYHRPREWLEDYLARSHPDMSPISEVFASAEKSGFSIDDIQAAAGRITLRKKTVKGQRCWGLPDEN